MKKREMSPASRLLLTPRQHHRRLKSRPRRRIRATIVLMFQPMQPGLDPRRRLDRLSAWGLSNPRGELPLTPQPVLFWNELSNANSNPPLHATIEGTLIARLQTCLTLRALALGRQLRKRSSAANRVPPRSLFNLALSRSRLFTRNDNQFINPINRRPLFT